VGGRMTVCGWEKEYKVGSGRITWLYYWAVSCFSVYAVYVYVHCFYFW